MKIVFTGILWCVCVCAMVNASGQQQRSQRDSIMSRQESKNGYILPVNGHLHILVVFAEVGYVTENDPSPDGTKDWKKGKLPVWKDQLFDPHPTNAPISIVSSFFYEASFGNYIVTGDYLINPENPDAPILISSSGRLTSATVLEKASAGSGFITKNNFQPQDFDRWTMTHIGHPKTTPSADNPMKYDHIMIIVRNATYPSNLSGWTSSRSGGRLFGYESDTYSFFCTHQYLPFNILLHEYSHMLFGGNNFHAGGSHSKKAGHSYFPHIQCGWGMMGAAWKSFLTPNAWERRRLGWKPATKRYEISALDSSGTNEVSTDLDPVNTLHQGVYVIRDFMSTGDAVRIRLPQLPGNVFQQWLWIENHQTRSRNNSRFDQFQYEDEDCMDKATPGLYMYIQVDKENLQGKEIFDGYADYLHPLPANGLWDIVWGDTTVQNPWCINNHHYYPHRFVSDLANPFSGNHEMELVFNDYNENGKIELEEYRVPAIRKTGNRYQINLPVLGAREHAFTPTGKKRIGIDTNPSANPLISSVTASGDLFPDAPNNRTVYLNGISVTLMGYSENIQGALLVKIRFDDFNINEKVRWCADTIVFAPINKSENLVLTVHKNSSIHIDRGQTPTRITNPEQWNNKLLFSKPTVFVLMPGAVLYLKDNAELRIDNGSRIIVMSGSTIRMDKKASISIVNGSSILFMPGSSLQRQKGAKIKISSDSSLEVQE
jgi:hypothetical protein